MKRRNVLLGFCGVLALTLAVPALGGPSNPVAEKALSLSKVKKTANTALSTANSAQTAAGAAQSTANGAQSAAGAAQGAANTALATASGKQDRVRWAHVTAAGTIDAQSGGISVTTHATGAYILDFGSSVANRAIIASLNAATSFGMIRAAICGGTGNPGGVICAMGDDTSHVIVNPTDAAGALADRSFYLTVTP